MKGQRMPNHFSTQLGFSPHRCPRRRLQVSVGGCVCAAWAQRWASAARGCLQIIPRGLAAEGSLISQTHSQTNGLVAEFRHRVFFDNQSREASQKLSSIPQKSQVQTILAGCLSLIVSLNLIRGAMSSSFSFGFTKSHGAPKWSGLAPEHRDGCAAVVFLILAGTKDLVWCKVWDETDGKLAPNETAHGNKAEWEQQWSKDLVFFLHSTKKALWIQKNNSKLSFTATDFSANSYCWLRFSDLSGGFSPGHLVAFSLCGHLRVSHSSLESNVLKSQEVTDFHENCWRFFILQLNNHKET